ncbi:MAG: MFS transporter [Pseudomonadota bacterium]
MVVSAAKTPNVPSHVSLLFGMFGNSVGAAFLFAALPLLGRQLGYSDIETGILVGLGALGLLIAAPLWGWATERLGRRPVLLIGFAGAALAPAGIGLTALSIRDGALAASAGFILILIIRIVQTATTGGLAPAAQAYMADTSGPHERSRAMGLLGGAFGLGGIAGAALLWRIAEGDPFQGFYTVAALSLLAFALAVPALRESRQGTLAAPRRLKGRVGLDPSCVRSGSAKVTVLADSGVIWTGAVDGTTEPVEINAPLKNAVDLTLRVDYGDNLDAGDHVHFANLRVIQ